MAISKEERNRRRREYYQRPEIKERSKKYYQKNKEKCLGDCSCCKANHLFTSNRQEGCKTVLEFFEKRFDRRTSPFSKKFMYNYKEKVNA